MKWWSKSISMVIAKTASRNVAVKSLQKVYLIARFALNYDDYRCVACCKRVNSCGEIIKKRGVSFFLSDTVGLCLHSVIQ